MTLNKHSRLMHWSYSLYRPYNGVPYQTSLCAFFWRTFVLVPLTWAAIVTFALSVIAMAVWLMFVHPWQVAGVLGGAAVLTLTVLLGLKWLDNYGNTFQEKVDNTWGTISGANVTRIFVHGVKTVKGRMCPIIKIEG